MSEERQRPQHPRRPIRGFGWVRIARGWTVAQACIRLGISPSYLRALESGRKPWPIPIAEKMRRVYECDLNTLGASLSRIPPWEKEQEAEGE